MVYTKTFARQNLGPLWSLAMGYIKKTHHILKEARGKRDGSKDLPSFTSSNGASSCCLMGRILYIYILKISSPCPHMVQDKRVERPRKFQVPGWGSRVPYISFKPASSRRCCLNPKGLCMGTPYHAFITTRKIRVGILHLLGDPIFTFAHPGPKNTLENEMKLTWNLQITQSKRKIIFQHLHCWVQC